ncbi:MAG: mechanosensitive ion channel family protein [Bacteroidetes bacterium]|nr:MAG: mechanosensitive ion channel family protein [Bacteroidota bacterium]
METISYNFGTIIAYSKETQVVGISIILLCTAITAKIIDLFITKILRAVAGKSKIKVDDVLIEIVHRPIINAILLSGLLFAVDWSEFHSKIIFILTAVIKTVLLFIVWRTINKLLKEIFRHWRIDQAYNRDFVNLFENLGHIVLVVSCIALFFILWEIDVTPIVASAGVLGLAIAFAAKDTIANLFGGVNIFIDRPFKTGDYIILETGDRGEVIEVGVRSTLILTRDDIQISIPNSVIVNSKIINESAPEARFRVRIKVGVAYGTDIDHVEKVLLDVAASNNSVASYPEPRVRFRTFGDSSLDLELLCWVNEPSVRGRVIHELNKMVYKEFNKNHIIIPFPQRDVYIQSSNGNAK